MLNLEVITPERLAFTEKADFVVLPGVEGEIGVLPGHAPILAQLSVGELRIKIGEQTNYFAVSGGFAEVLKDQVKVFAETAELESEINEERARMAAERAKADIKKAVAPVDLEVAQAALRRSLLRLRLTEKMSKRRSR